MKQSQHLSTLWSALPISLLVAFSACGDADESEPAGTSTQGTGGSGAGSSVSYPPGCSCFACAPFQAACQAHDGVCPAEDPADVMCDSSLAIVQGLTDCLCNAGGCAEVCPSMCAPGTGEDSPDECLDCKLAARQGECQDDLVACQTDTECTQ